MLTEAIERSITFFDTADVYGQGDSERLIGAAMRGRRDQLVICTKAGLRLGAPHQLVRLLKPIANPIVRRWRRGHRAAAKARQESARQCFRPEYVRQCLEGSLRRLGTDHVDVFLLHNPPMAAIADDALFETLDRLKADGAVRNFGVSAGSPDLAMASLERPGVSCLQLEVNVFTAQAVEPILRLAKQRGIGVIAREPLAGGRVIDHPVLEALASKRGGGATAAALALRFVADRSDVDVVLTGMTCRRHLHSNLAAFDQPPLSPEEADAMTRVEATGAMPR